LIARNAISVTHLGTHLAGRALLDKWLSESY